MVFLAISMTLTTVTVPLMIEAIFGVEAGTSLVGTFMGIITGAAILSAPVCNMIFDIIGIVHIAPMCTFFCVLCT
jgi:hypothetical protein